MLYLAVDEGWGELVFSGTVLRNFHYLNLHSLLRSNTLLLLYTF